jgi:hypothetical protein
VLAMLAIKASRPPPCLLRIFAAMALLPLAGCATSLTMERISPTERRADFVREVKSAHREPSGTVVVCVLGQRAHTPWPFGSGANEEFSVSIPPDAPVTLRKSIRYEIPRFEVSAANVGRPCPAEPGPSTAVPVRTLRRAEIPDRSYFSPDYPEFMALVGAGDEAPALWTVDVGYLRLFYVSDALRFENRRAVEIETGPRDVEGQPAYVALLPFAVVWDVLALPFYLLWALAGGPHGR